MSDIRRSGGRRSARPRRRRGGAAGRADGGAGRGGAVHPAADPELRDPRRGGAGADRGERRDGARGDRRALLRQPRGAAPLEGRRRRRARRPGAPAEGAGAHALRHGAAGVRAAGAQPGARRDDRRQGPGAGAGLRAALRARHGERAALCDDRGLPQLREARLFVEVAAPFGRHGLRADRRRGEQAASRHAAGAHDAAATSRSWASVTAPERAAEFGRDVQDPVRRRERRAELLHDLADQHQLAAGLRRDDDGRARGLCPRRAGDDRLAVHRRRGDGAGQRRAGR